MTTLAVDPGETTGLAARVDGGSIRVTMAHTRESLYEVLGQLVTGDQVVIEDFVTAGRISKHGLYTVRLVGAVEALCWAKGAKLVKQVPMYRVHCLAAAGGLMALRSGYAERHEKDALAHLLAFERDVETNGRTTKVNRRIGEGECQAIRVPIASLLAPSPNIKPPTLRGGE